MRTCNHVTGFSMVGWRIAVLATATPKSWLQRLQLPRCPVAGPICNHVTTVTAFFRFFFRNASSRKKEPEKTGYTGYMVTSPCAPSAWPHRAAVPVAAVPPLAVAWASAIGRLVARRCAAFWGLWA